MSDREYIEIAPLGTVGDGAVVLGYNPDPAPHQSAFELYYEWDGRLDKSDTVYIGGRPQAAALADALNEVLDRD